ncbi:hypothetical protein Tco_0631135 [Tanacetum coccineum]
MSIRMVELALEVTKLCMPPLQMLCQTRPFKKLTQQELEEKRAKHLCFYCDQKYSRGHKCSGQLYSLEAIRGSEELEEDRDVILTEEGVMNTYTTSLMDEPPLISLNALSRENTYRTIRVRGCRLRKMYPLEVYVANGHVMTSLAWNPVVVNIKVDQWMQWKPQSSGKAMTTELSTVGSD